MFKFVAGLVVFGWLLLWAYSAGYVDGHRVGRKR